ncbi:amino acid racemase [bacterium]|nr:amino acid racemase [bacterium]
MIKHIGIIACSYEGAALCYRTICLESARIYGHYDHPEITMHTYEPELYFAHVYHGDWDGVAGILADSAKKLALCGADFAICPDNSNHMRWETAVKLSPIPLISIVDVVGNEIKKQGINKVGLLGTKYTMTGKFYPEPLKKMGIEVISPDDEDRKMIDNYIFDELIFGIMKESTRKDYVKVIEKFKAAGAQGVILGCTEIPLLITQDVSPIPIFDSTRLLAKEAVRFALE